jgi:hypothetical protein
MSSEQEPNRVEKGMGGATLPTTLKLEVDVTDPELIAELIRHPEGLPRRRFVNAALRIGILSLKQAEGRIDAAAIRNEGDHLLAELSHFLDDHQKEVSRSLSESLKDYFDPQSGRFNERVNRLIAKDGELAQFMAGQVGDKDSKLASTLASHVGETSPIMKLLSPDNASGFLATLGKEIEDRLSQSREKILKEFSLDDEESAISRLVGRVEKSQRSISEEFSLDDENSALSRMKKELLAILEDHKKESDRFRTDVLEKLAAITSRREEAMRSTRHGGEFETEVGAFLSEECLRSGDVFEDVTNQTGMIKNCKVGDHLIRIGPESAAAGACIVFEAKENASYTLAKALDELSTARKNRAAPVGVFVCSATTAPDGFPVLARYGQNIIVVWDKTDPLSDTRLWAAITIARAISVQQSSLERDEEADFEPIRRAIKNVEKLSAGLDEITTLSNTIYNNSNKIRDRARVMGEELKRQVAALDRQLDAVMNALGGGED